MTTVAIEPLTSPPDAVIEVPGSKSLTNRALLLAELAGTGSRVDGALVADDSDAMLDALAVLRAGGGEIDARRAATVARFLLPVLAALPGRYRIDASPQLRARPMRELVAAVRDLGGSVTGDGLPLEVGGGMHGGLVKIRGDLTSQFVSGLMLAGPLARDGIEIEWTTPLVGRPFVDMTAHVMRAFGVDVSVGADRVVVPAASYKPATYAVEPDASAASYFLAAAAITGGSVRVPGLLPDSVQGDARFADVLADMGAHVTRDERGVEVRGGGESSLQGVRVDLRDMPDMVLTLAAIAPFAVGPTTIEGVGFIRGHESDRLAVAVDTLVGLGADAFATDDGLTINSGPALHGGSIDSHDDHRVAMAFALVGLRVPGVSVVGAEAVDKTFPGYWDALASLRAPCN